LLRAGAAVRRRLGLERGPEDEHEADPTTPTIARAMPGGVSTRRVVGAAAGAMGRSRSRREPHPEGERSSLPACP